MANANETVITTSGNELTSTRILNAPRELVFRVWTDPEHIVKWWGPDGFTNTIKEMSVKPDGIWRFTMHGPDGTDFQNRIEYKEVVVPEKLVFLQSGEGAHDMIKFHVTVTFDERGDKTKLTMKMRFPAAEELEMVAREYGAIEGNKQTLNKLEEYLEQTISNMASKTSTITREINAPCELVYKAWTDPAHMANWWGPRGFTNPVCELDIKPGGAIHIQMSGMGRTSDIHGVFHEVVENKKLVFTHSMMPDGKGGYVFELMNTITFEDINGRTKLTIHAVVVKSTRDFAGAVDNMDYGFVQSLDKLEELLAIQMA